MNKKRYLFISPYFYPEILPINNFFRELSKTKDVIVLTSLPSYRKNSFYDGYNYLGPYKERYGNIQIIRVPVIPRLGNTKFLILLFYFSFFLMSFFVGVIIAIKNRGKIIDIMSFGGSPVFTGYIGILMSFIAKCSSSIWIQDIWPEAIISTVGLKNRFFLKMIDNLQEIMWSKSDKIYCQSEVLFNFIKKKFPSKKSYLLHNTSGIKDKPVKNIKKKIEFSKLNLVYAGQIGFGQNLENILYSLTFNQNQNIILYLCGEGAAKENLVAKYRSKNIIFLNWLEEDEMFKLFEKCHMALVSLNAVGRQSLILPGKVQAYVEMNLPILSINSGATNEFVEKNQIGYSIRANEDCLKDEIYKIKKIITNKLYDNWLKNLNKINKSVFNKKLIVDKYLISHN